MKKKETTNFSQLFSEFIGVFIIVLFGTSSLISSTCANLNYNNFEISIIWGFIVSIAIYIAYPFSGAHLNPAITISFWILNFISLKKLITYVIMQFFGGFFGAIFSYIIQYKIINNYIIINDITYNSDNVIGFLSLFSTYPSIHLNFCEAFVIEFFITAILMSLIILCNHDKNIYFNKKYIPLIIGSFISIIGISLGHLTGFALNPARDLGPKIFLFIIGWGDIVLSGGYENCYYLWVPLIATTLGSCSTAIFYRILRYFKKVN